MTPQYFDAGSYIGGGERYPLNVARGLVAATDGGMHVTIVSFGPSAAQAEIDTGVSLRVLPVAYVPANRLNPVSWELPACLEDMDVIHVFQMFTRTGEAAILAATVLGKPVLSTDVGGHGSNVGRACGMLDITAGVICISDFSASLVQTSAPVTVVRGGIDTAALTPPTTEATRDYVLYVGRLLPHKGIDTLIRAMPEGLPLVVCGTPYDDAYFEHLQSLAAGRLVEFRTGSSDADLLDLYRNALATVLPSVYRDYAGTYHRMPELMGLTLLEAMACGTPAVCSNVGGMPELVEDGVTGFVYKSEPGLGDVLTRLRDHPEIAATVGQAARRAAVEQYDIGVVGARIHDLYREALAAR